MPQTSARLGKISWATATPRVLHAWEFARQHPETAAVFMAGLRTVTERRPELCEALAELERQAGSKVLRAT